VKRGEEVRSQVASRATKNDLRSGRASVNR
jgi:hypothetical protein